MDVIWTPELIINELINPVFNVLAVLLRFLGVLGAGLVAGSVLRHSVAHKLHMRFYVPLIFLGIVLLYAASATARWSSPGALAALGLGLLAGFRVLRQPVALDVEQFDMANTRVIPVEMTQPDETQD